jgi:hypothetical protein
MIRSKRKRTKITLLAWLLSALLLSGCAVASDYLLHALMLTNPPDKLIYTIGQDNNLSACLFYIKSGFVIGGFNTHVYGGTNQANKSNIYFYLDV